MLLDKYVQQDDSRQNEFGKKTHSETISCYTNFINGKRGAQGLLSEGGPLSQQYARHTSAKFIFHVG